MNLSILVARWRAGKVAVVIAAMVALFTAAAYAANVNGTNGDDTLSGTERSDVIQGRAGNDVLSGLAGTDVINGGLGNDVLYGGPGEDSLRGGGGNDLLVGDENSKHETDEYRGGPGYDRCDVNGPEHAVHDITSCEEVF